jgi:hypothetical protein
MMVRAIDEGATAHAGLTIAECAVTGLVDAVIPVGSARFLHVLNADHPSSKTLAGPLPRPRLLQEDVSAWTTLDSKTTALLIGLSGTRGGGSVFAVGTTATILSSFH